MTEQIHLFPDRTLVEGMAGTWYYHLADLAPTKRYRALCGAEIMTTTIPETAWGTKSHLKERYCPKCAEIRRRDKPVKL